MENTYSHNCMIHRDTMLKFGALFDLAKYFEHTYKFKRTEYGRGLVAHTLNLGHPFYLSNSCSWEVEIWHTCRHLRVLTPSIKICPLGGVWGNQELPIFILGPPSLISPTLIELESWNLVSW